jgi:putative hemolysin
LKLRFMDVLLIVLLTLLNALFAMSEMALSSSRRALLVSMAEDNMTGAQAALELQRRPTEFLSTIQIGITTLGMLNGIIGEAAFSEQVSLWFEGLGATPVLSGVLATATVVTLITLSTILFGELVPKRIGQIYPETAARMTAPAMLALSWMARPLVKALSFSTATVLRFMRIDLEKVRQVTEEEITASLVEGVDAGVIEQHEHQMVQNVFRLDERPLTSLMTPRGDVHWLDASASVDDCLRLAGRSAGKGAHSWYPVCRASLDDVVGVISVAHLLDLGAHSQEPIAAFAQAAVFVPETLSGMELLEQFRLKAARLLFVVDEYGVVQGLLTPRDLLEAITGELQYGAQTEAWATRRDDGSWLLDGVMPVAEVKARLDLEELPDEDRGRYNTLAGLLMALTGHLPALGERISHQGWVFEVIDLDGRRVDKVLATQRPAPKA